MKLEEAIMDAQLRRVKTIRRPSRPGEQGAWIVKSVPRFDPRGPLEHALNGYALLFSSQDIFDQDWEVVPEQPREWYTVRVTPIRGRCQARWPGGLQCNRQAYHSGLHRGERDDLVTSWGTQE